MQFVLMCCFNEDQWQQLPVSERDRVMADYQAWVKSLAEGGEHVSTIKLQGSQKAATVRVKNGDPFITDGPFAETREQIGGFHVINCENLDEAVAIANRIPTLPVGGTIEVRPVETF
jgi:hypothetical protein